MAAWAAVAAACLAAAKLVLFGLTGSLIVALSAWDSVQDVIVSFANHRIVRFARQNADEEHPYGHGKAESIAALLQGALIIGGGIVIFGSSVQKLGLVWQGEIQQTTNNWQTIVFFLFAAMISFFISFLLKRSGVKYRSPALAADAEHYKVDVATNIASAVGLALVLFTHYSWLDPLLAAFFAFYIGFGGFQLMRTSVKDLMDQRVSSEIQEQALRIIWNSDKRIVDVHNFRGRNSGHRFFFDFHVTLPLNLSFLESHNLVEKIEDALKAQFDSDVVVHADPDSLPRADSDKVVLSRHPTT